MKGRWHGLVLSLVVLSAPAVTSAGWVIASRNVAIKGNGERQPPEDTTMYVAGGKVRIVQPNSISLIDYNTNRFTILNPQRDSFWSGTLDEYVVEVRHKRKKAAKQRLGSSATAAAFEKRPDDAKLPAITVQNAGPGGTIAGHETVKYVIQSAGEAFQEVWVAEGLDLSRDLDPQKYLAYQEKMSTVMVGKSGGAFSALYRNPEARKIHAKGFVVQTKTQHVAGGFERTVTTVRSADVADEEFAVPDNYRRVRLADVFGTAGES